MCFINFSARIIVISIHKNNFELKKKPQNHPLFNKKEEESTNTTLNITIT
jgi:hypothetical protein